MGKHPLTEAYAWFLARWARRLSWREVAEAFQMNWEAVFGAVEMAVLWGRPQVVSGIHSLGIDEFAWRGGHGYLTMVYQIDARCKRLLWVGEKRTVKTLLHFFRWLGKERSAGLRFICSDMWKPYLKVIAKKAGQAIHVLDRFHIMAHLSKAIDEVRAQEARALKAQGYDPVLTKTRWLFCSNALRTSPRSRRLDSPICYDARPRQSRTQLTKRPLDYRGIGHCQDAHVDAGAGYVGHDVRT